MNRINQLYNFFFIHKVAKGWTKGNLFYKKYPLGNPKL